MGSGGSSQSRQPKQGCERLGITIHQLQEVDILVQRYQKDWSEVVNSPTVQHVVDYFIKPETKSKKQSYVEVKFAKTMTPPTWFSCHPWSINHASLVLGLQHSADRHCETSSTSFWLAAYCLCQHKVPAADQVLPAVFGSRYLSGIIVHVDSQREIWKRMWCLSEMLASLTHDDLKMSLVTIEESEAGSSAFSLSDHLVGTETEGERRSWDEHFPLSAFGPHQIEIHRSRASDPDDEQALLGQIISASGEAAPTSSTPRNHQAYNLANTKLRSKIEAAAMRVAVLVKDRKMEEHLLTRAANEPTLRSELKRVREATQGLPVSQGSPLAPPAPDPTEEPQAADTEPPSPEPAPPRAIVQGTRTAQDSKRLGARLEYLLKDFPRRAKESTGQDDPTFRIIDESLARGPTGLGYNRPCPRDGQLHCSMVDALRNEDAQKATVFLSWCWDYHLQMYVKTWEQWLQHHPDAAEGFVWQCFFCNNQYRMQEVVVDDSLGEIFQDRLLDIQQMVVMLDKFMQPQYLERVWCVFEMYTAAKHPGKVTVDIILPPDQAADIQKKVACGDLWEIQSQFQEVNVENAKASRPEDERKVKEIIKRDSGFHAVNEKVRDTMMHWVLGQVRSVLLDPSGTAKSAADFMAAAGLANWVGKLEDAGIQSFEELEDLQDADLEEIGLDLAARKRLLEVLEMGPSAKAEVDFKVQLRQLGLNTSIFEGLSEDEVMRDRKIEEKLANLGEKKKFRKWRQTRLTGEAVVEELVALDMLVERGPDWCYDGDSDDEYTPEDGGPQGVGKVVAFHSKSGEAMASHENCPPRPGWVKVHWQVTGWTRSYRMGTLENPEAVPEAELQFAAATTPQQHARALREVQKGELQLHHLRCTFGYRCGTNFPHYTLFDIRPEACEKVAGFKPGDIVEDEKKQRATCVGLKYRGDAKKVDLWFQVQGNDGAGVYRHSNHDRSLRKVGQKRLQEVKREEAEGASDGEIDHDEREWVAENLKPTLKYLSKSCQQLHFDVRDEIVEKFRMPYKSGDVLIDKGDGEKMTCIGVACDPIRKLAAQNGRSRGQRVVGSVAELWFHLETSSGAGLNAKMHKALSRFQVVHNEPVQEMLAVAGGAPDSWDKETAIGLLESLRGSLKLDFVFPRGAGENTALEKFDVREDVVQNVVGFKPGTVLSLRGAPAGTRLTLVGLRPDPDNGEISVWWHHEES
ncbi:unnamed protein product [Durusdinium trenchii]|uniref:Uncharacterized protein n=1 Tax=Durusdinium trenchii TaxID=1381693 RepID=A0ABP0LQU5_9DINO